MYKVNRLVQVGLVLGLSIGATSYAAYPEKLITAVVPFPPGGSVDPVARIVVDQMRQELGAEVIILNKPGAGGTLGTTDVANADPDGYTIGFVTVGPLTSQPHLRSTVKYDIDSFEYVCRTHVTPQVFAVSADSKYKTLKDLVEDGVANPGTISMASQGVGSIPHLASNQFARLADIDWIHIPTKGDGEAVGLAASGNITGWVAGVQTYAPLQGSRLRALGILEEERSPLYPEIPTFKEQGYDVVSAGWGGIVVPKGTPASTVEKLSESCYSATHSPAFEKFMQSLNIPQGYQNAKDFETFVREESKQYKEIIEREGIKVE